MSVDQLLREEPSRLPPKVNKPDYLCRGLRTDGDLHLIPIFRMVPFFYSQLNLVFTSPSPLWFYFSRAETSQVLLKKKSGGLTAVYITSEVLFSAPPLSTIQDAKNLYYLGFLGFCSTEQLCSHSYSLGSLSFLLSLVH